MKSLADIPDRVKAKLPDEVIQAIDIFSEEERSEIILFLNDETREVDCVGFVGPDGRVCKYADVEKYNALLIIEEQARKEFLRS